MKKSAFTLAEVLITLGIIGIVAALTIPQLVSKYQNQVLYNQLKTTYSDLNKASRMFMIHNDMSVSEYANLHGSTDTMKLFMKEFTAVLKNKNLTVSSVDDDGNRIEPYKMYHIRPGNHSSGFVCDQSGYFWDPQGRVLSLDDKPHNGHNGPKVCVDINGLKKPNKMGMDYFVFMFTVDGLVIPFGQPHKNNPPTVEDGTSIWGNASVADPKNYCIYNDTTAKTLFSCSHFALINSHPTASNKDYWHDFVNGR